MTKSEPLKSIYRCSKYGFLEVDHICDLDRSLIELAILCIHGVYGTAFVEEEKKLHIIFNPTITNLNEISQAILLIGLNIRS
jgi:hypothetical protein